MAQAKGGPAFDLSSLQAGAKSLQPVVPEAAKKDDGAGAKGGGGDEATIQAYVDLYNKFGGDLDRIFDELGENPGKAKKYPPKDAQDFADKYYQGGYTYANADRAEAK